MRQFVQERGFLAALVLAGLLWVGPAVSGAPPVTEHEAASGRTAQAEQAEQDPVARELARRRQWDFRDLPLREVVEFMREVTGLDFLLYQEDIPPDGAPVTLSITADLETALDLIAEMTDMAWRLREGAILIGRPESLETYETRVYVVTDLLVDFGDATAPPRGLEERTTALATLIQRLCAPGTWHELPTPAPTERRRAPGQAPLRQPRTAPQPPFGGPARDRSGQARPSPFGEAARDPWDQVPEPVLPQVEEDVHRGRVGWLQHQPGRIVVHHTVEVHGQIRDLLESLRGRPPRTSRRPTRRAL